ncbi:hypothetical protein B7P43_G10600 [Cryptotermes secundus]|uniref:Schwannomin interacting protein 1 C-terminal domain-containing protein n=1 Tax=Cryptotermes secundus TaxID=105785 RepID=A0A2J7Q499_9NEOP|nr:hypothetical protein B7P43_G10600 [Cryptotermes secundus]
MSVVEDLWNFVIYCILFFSLEVRTSAVTVVTKKIQTFDYFRRYTSVSVCNRGTLFRLNVLKLPKGIKRIILIIPFLLLVRKPDRLIMFEDIISNIKAHSAKVSEALTLENLRAHTLRFTDNFDSLKVQTTKLSDNIVTTLKKSAPRYYADSKAQGKHELKWPVLVDNKMQWVTFPMNAGNISNCDDEDEDIVERFIRVISLDEEKPFIQRRNDREEIRRRLAMGSDADEYYGGERPGRKPSLQARLQSGMNLQICFMNETVSDTESPSSDTEAASSPVKMSTVPRSSTLPVKPLQLTPLPAATRPSTSLLTLPLRREPESPQPMTEADFFARQARLQAEARMALAQAKEMAHMQMEVERQRQKKSPITEMVRSSLEKVGIPFPEGRRRVSRQILTEMNVAQLQVIVNDLHTQIEILNEGLVKFLMDRDDLHMEQDSMLVDIEDLTRYLGAKEQTVKEQKDLQVLNQNNNNHLLPSKPKISRIGGLVKK